jgi:hypothetical protein
MERGIEGANITFHPAFRQAQPDSNVLMECGTGFGEWDSVKIGSLRFFVKLDWPRRFGGVEVDHVVGFCWQSVPKFISLFWMQHGGRHGETNEHNSQGFLRQANE